MKHIISIIFGMMFISAVSGQEMNFREIMKIEEDLKSSFDSLYRLPDCPERDSLNQSIILAFGEALASWDGFHYDWNELDMIGKVRSGDGQLNAYTWYLQMSPDEFKYFGFLQHISGKRKNEKVNVIHLEDHSGEIDNPATAETSPKRWYGVVYYGIHTFQHKRNKYYALLGYDFNNSRSRKKLVEVVQLDEKARPAFGAEFIVHDKKQKRFLIEYSAERAASLRYNDKLDMIVFDHLVPFNPLFNGVYQFYGPEGSFDGLLFEKGSFFLEEDIDARIF